MLDLLYIGSIEYWFENYKWGILFVAFFMFIIYLNKMHSKNINKAEKNDGHLYIQPKSIGEALLLHQQQSMSEVHQKNQDLNLKRNDKVRKFRFSTQQLHRLKEKPSKEVTPVDDKEIEISFKLLTEFDVMLPKIKGTYDDFLESIEKFCGIFAETKQISLENIQNLLHQKKYREIIVLVQECIEKHEQPLVLRKSKFFKWLQYGGFLEIVEDDGSSFVIDYHNIQLCEEINKLIQELLVKNYCRAHGCQFESIDELIEEVALEKLEEIRFITTYSGVGSDISELLVEDFMRMINSKKKSSSIKYRSLRVIFGNDNQDTYKVGELVWAAISDIQRLHQNLLEKIAMSTAEIQQLIISKNNALPDSGFGAPRPSYSSEQVEQEKVLRSTVLMIVDFLNWYPQDETAISTADHELINYFDKLLYSRKSRFAIVCDKNKTSDGKVFAKNLKVVTKQLDYTEKVVKKFTMEKMIGMEIKIAVPRQCEDYFPVKGNIVNIYKEETDFGNIIKFEVAEKNHLKSAIIFTGNNVDFIY
ncbi:hypothetical protein [Candidatus Uabimicrobium sp. HlEnr_7]|uniref:hypothetical protein n=1 Tax=Candidatus Uabimicrobium helgolandensis TaxID=3095367 RepID=UPI003556E3CE